VLGLGAVSAVMGALYALAEHDLKRLLAFSTIENTGIILLGLGTAMIGASAGSTPIATLGITAALFHVLSHAAFKGSLFLGAGAVQEATGTRDLDRLGGLVRVMPWTSVAAFVGAFAASGLPVSGGFASEWLTFQALLTTGSASLVDSLARAAALGALGAMGLAAALALATYVKATGMTYLALPRSDAVGRATEVGVPMRAGMVLLALACVALGLAATPVGAALQGVSASVLAAQAGPVAAADPTTLGTWAPLAVTLVLGCLLVAAFAFSRFRSSAMRRSSTWVCGIAPEPAFEYTATSFEKPARLFFDRFYRTERATQVELAAGTPFRQRVRYRSEIEHVTESRLYRPLHRASIRFAHLARRLQQGTLQLYVAYVLVAVVVLLVVAR
jgi:hydrogenase-4 component B